MRNAYVCTIVAVIEILRNSGAGKKEIGAFTVVVGTAHRFTDASTLFALTVAFGSEQQTKLLNASILERIQSCYSGRKFCNLSVYASKWEHQMAQNSMPRRLNDGFLQTLERPALLWMAPRMPD